MDMMMTRLVMMIVEAAVMMGMVVVMTAKMMVLKIHGFDDDGMPKLSNDDELFVANADTFLESMHTAKVGVASCNPGTHPGFNTKVCYH